jgi:hypothetical protein
VTIHASRGAVWRAVRDVERHVDWMEDAVAIRFTSPTTFDCETRVGPFRTTDRMEITEWRPGRAMGIRHVGLVKGTGRFTLRTVGRRRTRFTWQESLDMPWWMAPPIARVVLRLVWRRNLRNLKRLVEGTAPRPGG